MTEATTFDDFIDLEDRAEAAATAGWEYLVSIDGRVAWCGPDGHGDLQLEQTDQGWKLTCGKSLIKGSMQVGEAFDRASEYMETHPRRTTDS